ncbi:hypothetical protein Tco_1338573 [Tanacetum coccineum]
MLVVGRISYMCGDSIGMGASASLWFDNWCFLSPLAECIPSRDWYRAGLISLSTVSDVIHNGVWNWPLFLSEKYPMLLTLPSPLLHIESDHLEWRNELGVVKPQRLKTQDKSGKLGCVGTTLCLPNSSHVFSQILLEVSPFAKRKSSRSVIAKLVLAASAYFLWQERNWRLFKNILNRRHARWSKREAGDDLILKMPQLTLNVEMCISFWNASLNNYSIHLELEFELEFVRLPQKYQGSRYLMTQSLTKWLELERETVGRSEELGRKHVYSCRVNPVHAYYNGSCTSKDNEDPSWSTSFKTRRTQKTSSALEVLWKTLFLLYLYMIGTLPKAVVNAARPKAVVNAVKRNNVNDVKASSCWHKRKSKIDKMYLKHHEKQVEDILNYLDELHLHRIERMEEERTNGNELKTELKRIRTQIIRLQKKRLGQKDKIAFAHYKISDLEQIIEKICCSMPPKRTSTSAAPAMTQDAIRQLVADSVATALKAQAANMANTDNTNKNTGISGTTQ